MTVRYTIRMISRAEIHPEAFENTHEDRLFCTSLAEALQVKPVPPCLVCNDPMNHGHILDILENDGREEDILSVSAVFVALVPLEYKEGDSVPCGFVCYSCAMRGYDEILKEVCKIFAAQGMQVLTVIEGNETRQ